MWFYRNCSIYDEIASNWSDINIKLWISIGSVVAVNLHENYIISLFFYSARYKMILSIVIKISPFMPRGRDYAVSLQIRRMYYVLPGFATKECHGILIIILDPYMMHHFKANELLYECLFYIWDFDNHAWSNHHVSHITQNHDVS